MFYVGLIAVCIVLLVIFFGVTIAGGRAHDRQNRALKAAQYQSSEGDEAAK